VALVVEHLPVAGGGHGAPVPPEGYGAEPQEAVIRDIITNELTDVSDRELIGREGREKIKKRILASIKKHTDVHVEEVLFPDVTVQ
jgi:flagellar basal body-associated protein FliL